MNDFLQSLRNGNNRRFDRNRKSYDGHYGGGSDRRKQRDSNFKSFRKQNESEQLTAIKKSLETMVDAQRRLADFGERLVKVQERGVRASERLAKAEERKADAIEHLVKHFVEGSVSLPRTVQKEEVAPPQVAPPQVAPPQVAPPQEQEIETTPAPRPAAKKPGRKADYGARGNALKIIVKMRKEGVSYEKIARHLEAIDTPTLSGKGKWHGHAVYRLFQQAR